MGWEAGSREEGPGAVGYDIHGARGSFAARNEQHGLDIRFREHGFDLAVEAGRVSLDLLGVGRSSHTAGPSAAPAAELNAGQLSIDHGSFRMEYRNGPAGMRHDIVVLERPAGTGALEARLQVGPGAWPVVAGTDAVIFHAWDTARAVPQPLVSYSGLHVWDALGDTLPAHMEVRDDLVVLVVDDAHATYPVTIDPLSTSPNTALIGTQAGATWGFSVGTAGDVNGDGYSDLIVGEPLFDGVVGADAGRARIYLGSATGLSLTPAWTVEGGAAGDRFGHAVSTAGDMNGDGISEVLVGAPGFNGHGAAYLFLGVVTTGPGTAPSAAWTGDAQAGAEFGHAVALAGDVNDDGRSDVLVGGPKYDVPPTAVDRGRVYCYSGATMTLGWAFSGTSNNAQFGFAVCGAGDLNGDGVSDVAIGAPYQNSTPTTANGFVHLFLGVAGTGPSTTASANRRGPGSSNFGYSVSCAGDMNGDGLADLVVGAPGATSGAGAAHLFLGEASSAVVSAAAISVLNGAAGERLGHAVGLAGDVNGDGYGDVIIGRPGRSSNAGRAEVYRGGPSVMLDAAHLYWSRNGSASGGRLGAAVGTAGDADGDGFSEVVVGSPDEAGQGAVRVHHGSPDLPAATAQWTDPGTQPNGRWGGAIATAGDVNGDGYSDVIVGGDLVGGTGRACLYLGAASGLATTAAWVAVGENADDLFGHAVASAGDVNGDGYADVLVGAPAYPAYTWWGKVYLYLGSPAGLSATPAWTFTGPTADERCGWSVSSAGDVNGDGYSDVLFGSYMYDDGSGRAYLFHGAAAGLGAVPAWTAQGAPQSWFGASVSLVGDINGDGHGDIAIGAPFFDGPVGLNEGAVFVHHGSAAGASTVASWSCFGGQHGAEFGISVSYAGDVNGDGYDDMVAGAFRHALPSLGQAGRAYVFHGAPTTGFAAVPSTVLDGPWMDGHFGVSVSGAGDVNGDGFGDIIVGCPGLDLFYVDQGMAQVFTGSTSGVSPVAAVQMYGPPSGGVSNEFGDIVALAGDVDGDGFSDVLGSSIKQGSGAGAVYLYEGNVGRGMAMPTFQYRDDLTTPVRSSNGTFASGCNWGIGQFARSALGRSRVKLAWHIVGHGPTVPTWPFDDNNNLLTAEAATWTDIGVSGTLLKQALGVLPATSSQPAWRARLRHHPATALDGRMFGRWHRQGAHDRQSPGIKVELAVCGPLPVTLLDQRVACVNGNRVITWTTGSEQDCAVFVVQRSRDGVSWEDVQAVACSGNSTEQRNYVVTDGQVWGGTVYYRLLQRDSDGATELFDRLVAEECGGGTGLSAFPNPFIDVVHVSLNDAILPNERIRLVLTDMAGRIVAEQDAGMVASMRVTMDGLVDLPRGTYILSVRSLQRGVIGQARIVRD